MQKQNLSNHEQFVQDTIACQGALYGFILTLTADRDWADEILQETNVALLRKEDQFEPGTNFKAWACSVAYYQVLTSRKSRKRNRLVFDEQLISTLCTEAQPTTDDHEDRRHALRQCMEGLPPRQSKLLQRRYLGESVACIAKELGRTVGTISQTLYRVRQSLKDCVGRKLAEGKSK